ncbi:hypothetical protein MJ585_10690 [Klebsiella pneumoniae]|nr:hypothetical protein MJ585_10690 [Klebsiella pneumoniae]
MTWMHPRHSRGGGRRLGIAYFNNNLSLAGAWLTRMPSACLSNWQTVLTPWIAGILLSAILAAVMSTLSCQLSARAQITEDLYKAFLRKTPGQKEPGGWAKDGAGGCPVAIALAANPKTALGLVSYAWLASAPPLAPVVLFSVMWSRMTCNGALAGCDCSTHRLK